MNEVFIEQRLVIRHTVEVIVAGIEREYQKTQGLILTEADLQCLIYSKLRYRICSPFHEYLRHERAHEVTNVNINTPALRWRMKTYDEDIFATPIHTELVWYDSFNKLTIRPDITILLNPEKLSILHGFGDGYECDGISKSAIREAR